MKNIMDSEIARHSAKSATTFRKAALIIAMASIIYIDWDLGLALFAFYSAGPFLIFMAAAACIAIWHKSQVIALISRASVPVGMLVAALNTVHMLTVQSTDVETAMFATRLVFAPLSLGIVFSYLLPLADPAEANFNLTPSGTEQLTIVTLTLTAVYVVWTFLFQSELKLAGLIDSSPVLISVAVMAICMIYPGNENLSLLEKIARSGLFICVMAAVLGVAFYSSAAAKGLNFIGPTVLLSVLTILYGSFIVFVATILGGQSSMDAKEGRYFDWHLIESWVFLALMLMAPRTLIEMIQ